MQLDKINWYAEQILEVMAMWEISRADADTILASMRGKLLNPAYPYKNKLADAGMRHSDNMARDTIKPAEHKRPLAADITDTIDTNGKVIPYNVFAPKKPQS